MAKLSIVIVAFNEANKIEPSLRSVNWADEIVVVDLGSTDGTVSICRKYTDGIYTHPWVAFADPIRNYAMSLASHEWVLLLDADENVSPALAAKLREVIDEDWPVDVVTLERNHVRFGKVLVNSEARYGEAAPRLIRKGSVSWPEKVHALPSLDGLRVAHISRADAGGGIEHNTWVTVDDVLDRFARYTGHEAYDMAQVNHVYSTHRALHATWLQFSSIYFGQHAYRDGVPGLYYALSMAMYRLLVWMQLWEMQGRRREHDRPVVQWGRRLTKAMSALSPLVGVSYQLVHAGKRVWPSLIHVRAMGKSKHESVEL